MVCDSDCEAKTEAKGAVRRGGELIVCILRDQYTASTNILPFVVWPCSSSSHIKISIDLSLEKPLCSLIGHSLLYGLKPKHCYYITALLC